MIKIGDIFQHNKFFDKQLKVITELNNNRFYCEVIKRGKFLNVALFPESHILKHYTQLNNASNFMNQTQKLLNNTNYGFNTITYPKNTIKDLDFCKIETSILSKCNHEWTELTLFTSSITYCPKCNAEKK